MRRALHQRVLAPPADAVTLVAHPSHRVRWWADDLQVAALDEPAADTPLTGRMHETNASGSWNLAVDQHVSGDTVVRTYRPADDAAATTTDAGWLAQETIVLLPDPDGMRTRVEVALEAGAGAGADALVRELRRYWRSSLRRLARYVEITLHGADDDLTTSPVHARSRRRGIAVALAALGLAMVAFAFLWPLDSGGADDPADLAERYADAATNGREAAARGLYTAGYFDVGTWRSIDRLLSDDGCARPGTVEAHEDIVRITLALYDDCEGAPSRDPVGYALLPAAAERGAAALGPGAARRWYVVGEGVVRLDDAGAGDTGAPDIVT